MGFFDFVKDAGKSLFGSDEPEATAAEAIEKEVAALGLDGDVKVEVSGDTVKIAGAAPTQEAREKLILAAGNVLGVAKVEEEISVADDAAPAAADAPAAVAPAARAGAFPLAAKRGAAASPVPVPTAHRHRAPG